MLLSPTTQKPTRVLVTGATGNVGREVVDELLRNGTAVRAMTRNPDTAQLPRGVEVLLGDLTVPADVDRVVEGIETVFLVWTVPANAFPAAIERIAARAKRVVLLTSPHQTPHPFFQQPNAMAAMYADIERRIRATNLRWTFVRPGMFALNTVGWWAGQIRAGNVVRWPYGDAETAPIDERDIAAVAVRALLDERHDGGDYVITGPESLTQREQVETIGRAIGRDLRFHEISPEETYEVLRAPAPVVSMLLNAWRAASGQPAYVTSLVEEITGSPARTFAQWARDHAAAFTESPRRRG